MARSLRERQKEIAREAILNALADEVSEGGSLDFSIGDVAERAGVSHRTVYNYFRSRQDLIDAFSEWTDEAVRERGGIAVPEDMTDLPEAVWANFEIFEDLSAMAEVLARLDTADRATSTRRRRTEAFMDAIGSAHPGMDVRTQRALAALIRQIASVRSWYYMTREHGLTTPEAGAVSSWALEQLALALDRGEFPALPPRT